MEAAGEISEKTVAETVAENVKLTEEVPAFDVPSEEPSHVVEPSSGQARHAQLEEEEAERPKPLWTPSYTVTTLPGSGSSPRVDLRSELEEMADVEVEEAEGAETPKIVTHQDEEPVEPVAVTESSSWTQSYSTTSQPGSPRLSPKAELDGLESEPQLVESVQEPPIAAPVVELADVPETVVTPAAEGEDAAGPVSEEESKPAWTQSYSVTSQPGSPRVSPKQVPEDIPEANEPEPSWTQSYSVTSQPGSPRILPKEDMQEPIVELVAVADDPITVVTPAVEEATTVLAETKTAEQPKSTWTPSHSVATLDGQTEQAPLEDTEPESEVALIGEAPVSNPEVDVQVTYTSSDPFVAKDEQSERAKSPWTPSYSVTTLHRSSSTEEPNPDPIRDEPSADVESPAPEPGKVAEAVEDQPKENGTTSDVFEVHEAVAQFAVHDEAHVETPELDRNELDLVSLARFY